MSLLLEPLSSLTHNRAAMAALRKALIPSQTQRAYQYLPRLGCAFKDDDEILAFSIIAHFWGHYPTHTDGFGNLGRTLQTITKGDEQHPFHRRFQRLIACDSLQELGEQLRPIIFLVKKSGAKINISALFKDLSQFSRDPRSIKQQWCKGFYCIPTGVHS
jgi:CRISPR type I-E-associated protein CasB/Cse2